MIRGSPNVIVGYRPQARIGDLCACTAPIVQGSPTVYVNGRPAARQNDFTAHAGQIATGERSVILGNGLPRSKNSRLNRQQKEIEERVQKLNVELLVFGASLSGVVDPTPLSDGLALAGSLYLGDWLGAGISVVSMVPYIGDLAKLGKLGRMVAVVEEAAALSKVDPKAAERFKPALVGIQKALESETVKNLGSKDVKRMTTAISALGIGKSAADATATAAGLEEAILSSRQNETE